MVWSATVAVGRGESRTRDRMQLAAIFAVWQRKVKVSFQDHTYKSNGGMRAKRGENRE
jgi:hypothetical protein